MTIEHPDMPGERLSSLAKVPVDQPVEEVYASVTPSELDELLPELVGKVYQAAPPSERGFLVKYLMQPLGAMALLTVANGVFAKIRFQGGFNNLQVRMEDLQAVQPEDVVVLANRVQQMSVHALNGLGQMLASSPTLASSAVALVLIKILRDRAKCSLDDDSRIRSVPHAPERRARSA